jgi:hypothetical protein
LFHNNIYSSDSDCVFEVDICFFFKYLEEPHIIHVDTHNIMYENKFSYLYVLYDPKFLVAFFRLLGTRLSQLFLPEYHGGGFVWMRLKWWRVLLLLLLLKWL